MSEGLPAGWEWRRFDENCEVHRQRELRVDGKVVGMIGRRTRTKHYYVDVLGVEYSLAEDEETAASRLIAAVLALRGETRLPDTVITGLWDFFCEDHGSFLTPTRASVEAYRSWLAETFSRTYGDSAALLAEYRKQEAAE